MSRRFENPKLRNPTWEGPNSGDNIPLRINADVTALGSDNTDAAPIFPGFTEVLGANDSLGVILAGSTRVGDFWIIKVADGADLKVYPPAGGAINALTATTGALTVVDDVCFMIVKKSATRFVTLPLLPS